MIKEVPVTRPDVERHKFCDVCGVEVSIGLRCSKAQCEYCKRDLCNKCAFHEDDSGWDYRTVWCEKCWKIGEGFRPTIEKHQSEIERLYVEWQELCKKERENAK
jgi:hypothetical protein